jgi:hypothetical protein
MPGPLSSLLIATFAASVFEAGVGADSEVAAGRAPVDFAGAPKDSASFTVVPGAGVRRRSAQSTLTLSYTPRIYYRGPNALSVDRPLVLHQAALNHTWDAAHDISWSSTAQVSIGQLDYTAAGVVFDETISSAVRSSITDLFRATGTTGLRFGFGPRLSLNIDNSVEYTTTLDDTSVIPVPGTAVVGAQPGSGSSVFGTVIPDSFQVSTHPALGYLIGRDTHVGTSVDVTYQWFKDTARYLLISPDLYWDAKFGTRTTISLAGGVSYLHVLDAVAGQELESSVGGNAHVDVSTVVYRGEGTTATYGLDASLEYFFDPISGTSTPRAGATTRMLFEFGRQWTAEPIAAFYTVLKTTRYVLISGGVPVVTDPNDPNALPPQDVVANDATLVRLELPITYQASEAVGLSFGVRSNLRSRPLSDPAFKLNEQSEVWAFVGLTVRAATSSDSGAWLPF